MASSELSHFYEVAFIALGTLETICFAVHGLLFTVYSQYMASLTLPDNTNPPPVTGEIVWICRALTAVIVLSAGAAIPSLYALPGADTPTAQAVRVVLLIIVLTLAVSAYAIVRRMKVPRRD